MLLKLKTLYRKAIFNDSIIGFFVNPSFIARSALFRIFKQKAHLFNGLSILDVGCGSKPYERLFHGAKSYLGVDTNFSGHDHGNEKIDVFYDGKKLPFDTGQFDSVVSFQVLEHVLDEGVFLNEINRVLKDRGLLMISFPFCWPEHEQPYDFRRLTSFGAKSLLEKNDFEIIDMVKTTNSLQTVVQLLNIYLSMILKTRYALINIFIMLSFSPMLNLLGVLFGKIVRNMDLFSDLVIVARKTR